MAHDLWQRDDALRRAADLIEQSAGRLRAVSFDFFDTLVWRMVGKPTDVFYEVARQLHQENLLPATVTPADYEVFRRLAETKTRMRQSGKDHSWEDVSISDIYGQLQAIVKNPAAAARIEHAVECELCVLNPVMAGFIRHLRSRGLKLLITSDIYFSAAQLKDILRANRFDPDVFDAVLTSSDTGVCKETGNLFQQALKVLKLEADELLHIGDNFPADVTGARKAGVLGCHYLQGARSTATVLDRERFLLGAQSPVFSANSLRLLAARQFPGDSDDAFFGRAGTLIMGPVLTRFASWACDQFVGAGVRQVGALMREGELFGQLLQREAVTRGYDLEITPLYLNRRSTDLAAIGRLTADNLIAWLETRPTLSVKAILTQFRLGAAEFKRSPLALDEKLDHPEKVLRFAKFLFTPEIAQRIEAQSAKERRKVLDYLKPWLAGGASFGVCDIGYSASAQTQLKRILDLEAITTHVVGCYMVTYERAADRVLEGVDIRDFLGAFGHPDFYYRAFLRSPAFLEQAIVAALGTTLGYERQADGTVTPVLEQMPFDDKMVRRQRQFKQGVLEFQKFWHWTRRWRPDLLDGSTELSRRVLADADLGFAPILARVTAFPTQAEVEHFGSLALDDHYFADAYKTFCGEPDLEKLRRKGYAQIIGDQEVYWPQGVFHKENPRAATEFFSCGKAMLGCHINGDFDTPVPALTVIVRAGKNPAPLRECLTRVTSLSQRDLYCEVLLLAGKDDSVFSVAREFASKSVIVRILERPFKQTALQQLNSALDTAEAPLLMVLDDGVRLPAGWDVPLFKAMAALDVGMVLLPWRVGSQNGQASRSDPNSATRCIFARRSAVIEALALKEDMTTTGAILNLAVNLRARHWRVVPAHGLVAEMAPAEAGSALSASDRRLLERQCPDTAAFVASIFSDTTGGQTAESKVTSTHVPIKVDWIGSFLDHGSLSHVNRELTGALQADGNLKIVRVNNGAAAAPGFEQLAGKIPPNASLDAAITVRHAWPPVWTRPRNGRLVVIQPWEFGALPEPWVKDSAQVDEFWVPSQYVRRVYLDSGVPECKVVVVPNGVDTARFHPQVAPRKLATQKKFKFLFVGGTIFRKGPDLLLQAYLENFTAADDVCLVVKDFGGQGVYAGQTIEAAIRAAQSQPNAPEILYLNEELPPEDLPGLYTACDCLALPYRGEGFGLPVLEAMACGLPVMVTAGGATDDFVRDDFGWRIPSQRMVFGREVSGLKLTGDGWFLEANVAALGRCLREAFLHPAETQKRGQFAAEHARQSWSWQNAAAIAAQRITELATASPSPLQAERVPRKSSRIEPPNLPMPHDLPNTNAAPLLSPLRSHSDGRGGFPSPAGAGEGGAIAPGEGCGESTNSCGQGEVRALCSHSTFDVRCSMFDVPGFIERAGVRGHHREGHSETTTSGKVAITLPPCALVGHLAEARELVPQKKLRAAWESTAAALAKRPYHPEAFLQFAEIAHAAGDGPSARLCAEHARRLAPDWKPAKKFRNQRLNGTAKPDWLILPDELRTPQPALLPRLSVCLIVKNEEKFLGQCLKSVRGVASQIVVVDTGSTDRTVEIAREHGAEVHAFAWCDDFSAARNAALEHATGDWVLMLDADEELSADGALKLKAALEQPRVLAWRLPMVDVGHEADGVSFVPRLFRNAPGLFYLGRVHEQVFSSVEVRRREWGLENRLGGATLIHHGYTAELTRDRNKIERNLRLLEQAIAELPGEPHLLMNLGLELSRSGREVEALDRYQEAFHALASKPADEIVPELRESLLTQFCTRLMAARHFEEVVSVLASPLSQMNGGLTASLHFSLGLAQLELKRFREAADQMRQCLAKRGQRGLIPVNREIMTVAPHHCLALCLVQAGDPAGAEQAFQEGLKESGHAAALRLDYARFLSAQNRPADALKQLHELVTADANHAEAWRLGGQIALGRAELLPVARDWTHAAILRLPEDLPIIAQRAEALMLSGQTDVAAELWEKVWNRAPQPPVLAALILCQAVESPTTHAPQGEEMERAASRAFIEWYRKLLAAKANATVVRLNGQTDKLARALPTAAKILEAATAQAKHACAVEA